MRSTLRRGAVVVAGAAILSLWGSLASADPSYVPDSNDLVGVGSDTSMFVMDNAADALSATNPTNRVASFDALDPATGQPGGTIVAEQGVSAVPRPNGSSAGISALLADDSDGGANLYDFARSSRGPSSTNPVEAQELYFIPALRDGLSYAVSNNTTVPQNLTTAQLTALYRCDNPSSPYVPMLPQTGSGTRQFFLQQIGLSDSTIGSCVVNVQEHDAAPIAASNVALAPFSTARWLLDPSDPANPPSSSTQIAATSTGSTFYAERPIFNAVHKDEYDANTNNVRGVFGPGGTLCTRFQSGTNRQGFLAHPTCGTPINP